MTIIRSASLRFTRPIKLGQRSQGFAKPLLHEPANAGLAFGEFQRGELNGIKRAHCSDLEFHS